MVIHSTVGPSARWPVFVAIAAISMAVIVFEIALLRVFSFTIWHHFAFMVISVALLGFGISGTWLQLRPGAGRPLRGKSGAYALAFGVSAWIAVLIVPRIPFDPTASGELGRQLAFLGAYYLVLVVPFTFAGLAIVTLLQGFAREVNRLYAADLAGAGVGAALAVWSLGVVRAEGTLLLVIFLAAAGSLLLSWAEGTRRRSLAAAAILAVLALAALPWSETILSIPPGVSKGLTTWTLNPEQTPGAKYLFSRWNALARVDVVDNCNSPPWLINPERPSPMPEQLHLVLDGDATTALIKFDGQLEKLAFLDTMLPAAAMQALHPERVLVIGAGGGVDVLAALRHGARHVDAVEINPIVADLAAHRFRKEGGGIFQRDEVTLHVAEGRAFVRRSEDSYDAIQISLIDTWAATASGAYSLAEGYLYTVEAFADYLSHLDDDGVLVVSRWGWAPPREMLRLCTVADAALRRIGAKTPADHIVILGSGRFGSVIVKNTPFTKSELKALAEVSARNAFHPIYAPGLEAGGPFGEFLRSEDKAAFLASYVYDVSPVTDDRPFFFQFGRWQSLDLFGASWKASMLVLSGRLVLIAILLQALLLSLVLLAGPFALAHIKGEAAPPGAPSAVVYFLGIGLAFMLVEIALMQRFTLFLGSPLHATALILGALLLAAGAGSALSPRLAPLARSPWMAFAALIATIAAYTVLLPLIFGALLDLSLAGRTLVSILLVFPIGLVMGVPFPAAIARLEASGGGSLIGWAWAANGCASVLGPLLAVLLAIDLGLSTVTLAGAAIYLAAYVAYGPWWRRGKSSTVLDTAKH